jgi:hypothetical protein
MSKSVSVALRNPMVGHGGEITELIVKEPKGRDYMELGEPFSYSRTQEGLIVHVPNDAAIGEYFARCVSAPKGDSGLIAAQLSLVDAISVRRTILDFFTDALSEASAAPSKPSSSSDGSTPRAPAA